MKDRWGRQITIGWPEHHLLWVKAARSLPNEDRKHALQEISELTGRTFAAVYFKARRLGEGERRLTGRAGLITASTAYRAATASAGAV